MVYSDLFIIQKYNLNSKELMYEKKMDISIYEGYTLDSFLFNKYSEEIACIIGNSKITKCIFSKLL